MQARSPACERFSMCNECRLYFEGIIGRSSCTRSFHFMVLRLACKCTISSVCGCISGHIKLACTCKSEMLARLGMLVLIAKITGQSQMDNGYVHKKSTQSRENVSPQSPDVVFHQRQTEFVCIIVPVFSINI